MDPMTPQTAESPKTERDTPAASDDPSSQSPTTTGTALVLVEQEEPNRNWFEHFLSLIGFRSRGSLRDDLHEALAGEGAEGDVFSPEERAMLRNILRLREHRVEDVMVQRAEIQAVDEAITLGELLRVFEDTGHSRLPVFRENLDDPLGMVLVKDAMLHIVRAAETDANGKAERVDLSDVSLDRPLRELGIMRSVLFVPPSMLAADLMARMQATRTQMALVIDEYGGTDGLVSLEDIVEEVVGDIEDEHDEDEDKGLIFSVGDRLWNADARAPLERITEEIGDEFHPGEEGEDVETLGGLVFALAGHIPVRGEVVRGLPGFEFRVLEADPRRIRRLQIAQTLHRHPRRKLADAAE